jgi:hypothetical protein
MDEIAERLREVGGLNVTACPPPTVTAPAGFPSYPRRISYDATYGRGMDQIEDLPVWVIFGRVTESATRDRASSWAAGAGNSSVKAALERGAYASCDVLSVTGAEFADTEIAGVPYLAARFLCDIAGDGRI